MALLIPADVLPQWRASKLGGCQETLVRMGVHPYVQLNCNSIHDSELKSAGLLDRATLDDVCRLVAGDSECATYRSSNVREYYCDARHEFWATTVPEAHTEWDSRTRMRSSGNGSRSKDIVGTVAACEYELSFNRTDKT